MMPQQNQPAQPPLCHWFDCHTPRVFCIYRYWATGEPVLTRTQSSVLGWMGVCCYSITVSLYRIKKKGDRHHPVSCSTVPPHLYPIIIGSLSRRVTLCNIHMQWRQTPSSFVLELYHPVWVVVKSCPEVIATVE